MINVSEVSRLARAYEQRSLGVSPTWVQLYARRLDEALTGVVPESDRPKLFDRVAAEVKGIDYDSWVMLPDSFGKESARQDAFIALSVVVNPYRDGELTRSSHVAAHRVLQEWR